MVFVGSSIESLLWDLPRLNLYSTDLKILSMLARDDSPSYRSIGVAIGLMRKRVKSRVDKMLSSRVIDSFLAIENPSILNTKEHVL